MVISVYVIKLGFRLPTRPSAPPPIIHQIVLVEQEGHRVFLLRAAFQGAGV